MRGCIFCRIVRKEEPAFIVAESENFIAFLDIFPRAPGHTLIIPKEHFERFSQIPEGLGGELLAFSKKVILILSGALKARDFTLGVNDGSLAGQVVPHVHFHIMPRFPGDGGGLIQSVVSNRPKETLSEIHKKIREYVGFSFPP